MSLIALFATTLLALLSPSIDSTAAPKGALPHAEPAASTPTAGTWTIFRAPTGSLHMDLEWSDDNQWRRSVAASELHGLSESQIGSSDRMPVTFRIEQDAGTFEFEGSFRNGRGNGDFHFVVNREFPARLRSLGVKSLDTVSDHDLKNIAHGGVSAADIQELMAIGFTPLTLKDIVDLAIRFVTPEYARVMRSVISDANTIAAVTDLRFQGVPAEYARELYSAGYTSLTSYQVLELWRSGVTSEFIRNARQAGQGTLSPQELIEMKRGNQY